MVEIAEWDRGSDLVCLNKQGGDHIAVTYLSDTPWKPLVLLESLKHKFLFYMGPLKVNILVHL